MAPVPRFRQMTFHCWMLVSSEASPSPYSPRLNPASGLLLTAVVTKMRSPQTIGLECASPAIGVFHPILVPFVDNPTSLPNLYIPMVRAFGLEHGIAGVRRPFKEFTWELISLGRFGYTTRVRVRQDHSRRVLFERFLDDLSRMNRRTVDCAPEHFEVTDDTMPFVEED